MKKKPSMKYPKYTRVINGLREEIIRLFAEARKYHFSHAKVLNLLKEKIYSHEEYSKLPRYGTAELSGWIYCNYRRIDREHIEWRMFHPVHGWLTSSEMKSNNLNYSDILSCLSSHFWIGTLDVWGTIDFMNSTSDEPVIIKLNENRKAEFLKRCNEISGRAIHELHQVMPELMKQMIERHINLGDN